MTLRIHLRSPQVQSYYPPKPTIDDLKDAIRSHDLGRVQTILDSGLSLTSRSPLHLCVEVEFAKAIPALLRAGANPNQVDVLGRTALFVAMERRNDVAFCCLYNDTDVSIFDHRRLRPLNLALMDPVFYKSHLKDLIDRTKDLNAGDCDGNTPLHYTYTKLPYPSTEASVLQLDARRWLIERRAYQLQENNAGQIPPQVNQSRVSGLATKEIGHINSLLSFGSREYESANSPVLINRLTKMGSFKQLPKEAQRATENLSRLCYQSTPKDCERLAQKVARGCLVIIPICTKNHISYGVFFRGYFAICDRTFYPNQFNSRSLHVYSINRKLVTSETFRRFFTFAHRDSSEMHTYIKRSFLPMHGASRTKDCRALEMLKAKEAKTGACTYNNLKLAWRISMAFLLFKKGYSTKQAAEEALHNSKQLSGEFRKESIDRSGDEQAKKIASYKLWRRGNRGANAG